MPATGTPATGPASAGTGVAAVVVAAGRGIRIGGGTPKQYRRVGGQAVLTRTLAALAADAAIARIQPVIAADAADFFRSCLEELAPAIRAKITQPVEGGATASSACAPVSRPWRPARRPRSSWSTTRPVPTWTPH